MHRLALPSAALLPLASCLLASCVNVNTNIGERIRQGGEVRIGVNVREPVDGKEYWQPGTSLATRAARDCGIRLSPEVTYSPRSPWVDVQMVDPRDICIFSDMERAEARDVRPTGRIVAAELTYIAGPAFRRALPEAPARFHGTAVEACPQPVTTDTLGTTGYRAKPGFWRRVAAAPFDYVIDPVLSAAGTAVLGIPTACFSAVYIPLDYLINGVPK